MSMLARTKAVLQVGYKLLKQGRVAGVRPGRPSGRAFGSRHPDFNQRALLLYVMHIVLLPRISFKKGFRGKN